MNARVHSQNCYSNSIEMQELRGVNGSAVAAKAALVGAKVKPLLWFLQGYSMQPGGLDKLTDELLKEFPDRLGSPAMHDLGTRPGTVYGEATALAVDEELSPVDGWRKVCPDFVNESRSNRSSNAINELAEMAGDYRHRAERIKAESPRPIAELVNACAVLMRRQLPGFLRALCTDPHIEVFAPDEIPIGASQSTVPYFRDIVTALFEFQIKDRERVQSGFAVTTIAQVVFEALDEALIERKIALVEGLERRGKTESVKVWVRAHLGLARYITLPAVFSRNDFFKMLARELGLAQRQNGLRFRVETFLKESGLMLIIDESHWLFNEPPKPGAVPELVSWLQTTANDGVALALITTPQFGQFMQRFTKVTGWNFGQLDGRLGEWKTLPETLTAEDLIKVAEKLFAGSNLAAIQLMAGVAGSERSGHQLDALKTIGNRAVRIAAADGRTALARKDVQAAIHQVTPTFRSKAAAFGYGPAARRQGEAQDPPKGTCKPLRPGVRSVAKEAPAFPAPAPRDEVPMDSFPQRGEIETESRRVYLVED